MASSKCLSRKNAQHSLGPSSAFAPCSNSRSAVTIQRSRDAAKAIRQANDLTNELLNKNADNLRETNREVREQMERGVFDIEAVKHANEQLIATIQDSLQIADAGKAKRAAAEEELRKMEADLRDSLSAAKARDETPAA